jgi:hypothetical protein
MLPSVVIKIQLKPREIRIRQNLTTSEWIDVNAKEDYPLAAIRIQSKRQKFQPQWHRCQLQGPADSGVARTPPQLPQSSTGTYTKGVKILLYLLKSPPSL